MAGGCVFRRLRPAPVQIPLASGSSINTALASAIATYTDQDVDLVLEPGGTYANWTWPRRTTTNWITVRADASVLPASGVRISPSDAANLPTITTGSSAAAAVTQTSSSGTVAQYYALRGVYINGLTTPSSECLVVDGSGLGDSTTATEDVPHHFKFDQILIKGDDTAGVKRGFRMNGRDWSITNCHVSKVFQASADSQAIGFWSGTARGLIDNNYLEAAAENIMSGGTRCWTGLIPEDITVTNNVLTKDLAWRDALSSYQVKNVFEVKFGRRFTVEDNIIENSWDDNQDGWLILLTAVRNTSASQPFIAIEDIAFRRNIIRNGAGAIQFGTLSGPVNRITFEDNWFDNVTQDEWLGAAKAKVMQIRNGVSALVFRNNTITNMLDEHSFIYLEAESNNTDWTRVDTRSATVDDLTVEDNILFEGDYGIFHSTGQGTTALNALCNGYSVTGNVIYDDASRSVTYPAGNHVVAFGSDISSFDAGSPTFGQSPT